MWLVASVARENFARRNEIAPCETGMNGLDGTLAAKGRCFDVRKRSKKWLDEIISSFHSAMCRHIRDTWREKRAQVGAEFLMASVLGVFSRATIRLSNPLRTGMSLVLPLHATPTTSPSSSNRPVKVIDIFSLPKMYASD